MFIERFWYPIEKTKTVIRKIVSYEQKELLQKLAFDLNAIKKQRIMHESNEAKTASVSEQVKERNEKQKKGTPRVDVAAGILTTIVATPILTLIFGFIISIFLFILGWKADEDIWLPFLLAVPVAIGFCIYAIKCQMPVQSYKTLKRCTKGSGKTSFGGGWTPGCPEEKTFSFMNDAFDLDGNGHLNSIESNLKFDVFFGDDE